MRALRERGVLVAAYSPAGPGAVLMFDVSDIDAARALTAGLPLATAGFIDVELIELHPLEV